MQIQVNFDPISLSGLEGWLDQLASDFAGDERFRLSFHSIGRWGGPNDQALNVCGAEEAAEARMRLLEISARNGFSNGGIKAFLSPHGAACYAGKASSIVVGSDGTVYKCTVAFDDPRNRVGQITPNGELQINEKLWRLWTATDIKSTSKCTKCWFHASCQSRACPLAALDDPDQEPPCPSNPRELGELARISAYGVRFPM